jgi:chemotaxis protein CheD
MNADAPAARVRRVAVIQGECKVASDPHIVFTTTLGSCIAACIRDPEAGVGGMNHFLLPDTNGPDAAESKRYGAYAMELLINALFRAGASRDRLEAKIFGGGRLNETMTDIGEKNATFAEQFLEREGIRMANGSVRGRYARRIQYWPVGGRVRQLVLTMDLDAVFDPPSHRRVRFHSGAVELFSTASILQKRVANRA